MANGAICETHLPNRAPSARGKVRDIYDLGDRLIIVATDRISAFDVVNPVGIPDKGKILTALSKFWFERFADVVKNHLISTNLADFPEDFQENADLFERNGPWKQEGNLEVENYEQDGDQIKAHVELAARVVEGLETALVGRRFFRIRPLARDDKGGHHHGAGHGDRDSQEDQDRQVFPQQVVQRPPSTFAGSTPPRRPRPSTPLLIGSPSSRPGGGFAAAGYTPTTHCVKACKIL